MKERPILFSAPMVRAIMAGMKTQTRRVTKPQTIAPSLLTNGAWKDAASGKLVRCPYGQPGDRLWVRETFAHDDEDGSFMFRADVGLGGGADDWQRGISDGTTGYRWRPSIHMPRRASRILAEITAVRVERLQEISEDDLAAEGIQEIIDAGIDHDGYPRDAYRSLWERINGTESWSANPWVWVIEFRRVTA